MHPLGQPNKTEPLSASLPALRKHDKQTTYYNSEEHYANSHSFTLKKARQVYNSEKYISYHLDLILIFFDRFG